MSDVLFSGSGVLPSGSSSGSSDEQLNNEVSSGSSDEQLNNEVSSGSSDEQLNNEVSSGSSDEQLNNEVSSGSFNASIPEAQDVQETLLYVDSGSVNGLQTFNNNFVTLSFVIIFLLSAIFGTLLFSLLKDFFK